MTADPHGLQPIRQEGEPVATAVGALILLHGRGGSAGDILGLGEVLSPQGWALLAPQARQGTWYPHSFLAPREENEPFLSSALSRVRAALAIAMGAGIPTERIALCGFSQGACLATEFTGKHPQKYAALLAFTGGLIVPLDEPISLSGDLDGTPVLMSSGDPDPHVPWARVQQSADLLTSIGASVTLRRFPGRPHTIIQAEIDQARTLLEAAGKTKGESQKTAALFSS